MKLFFFLANVEFFPILSVTLCHFIIDIFSLCNKHSSLEAKIGEKKRKKFYRIVYWSCRWKAKNLELLVTGKYTKIVSSSLIQNSNLDQAFHFAVIDSVLKTCSRHSKHISFHLKKTDRLVSWTLIKTFKKVLFRTLQYNFFESLVWRNLIGL